MKKVLVIGASENSSRYSYLAIEKLRKYNYPVIAIGGKKGKVNDVDIITEHPALTNIDTVTLYLNKEKQKEYYEYILSLHPKRIIFNPGTENDAFAEIAKTNVIKALEACTLVMLNTGQF